MVAGCTVASKSYLASARVVASSFQRYNPGVPFFVLLADEADGWVDQEEESFTLIRPSDLQSLSFEHLCFRYPQQQFTYASTPFLLAHLLDRGFARVVFVKQESMVIGDLSPLFSLLERMSVFLTPHLIKRLRGEDRIPRELNILLSGSYNGGLLGVSSADSAKGFLSWWQDRVRSHAEYAVQLGMHYEQRWLDLVPALFKDVAIVRDPGYNVGHWSLPDHVIEVTRDGASVDGAACRLFRFSGYVPEEPEQVTKYSRRLGMGDIGDAALLFERYRSALADAGYEETRHWPYAYDRFDNGVPIPEVARSIYRDLGEEVACFGDPFHAASPDSFYRWLSEPIDGAPVRRQVSRLWHGIHRSRPDLQQAFPDPLGADRRSFLAWTTTHGRLEYNLPEPFTDRLGG